VPAFLFDMLEKNSHTLTFCRVNPQKDHDIPLPKYETEYAAGMDIAVAIDEPVCIVPGQRVLLSTGWSVAIPHGYEIQVRPRSGLAVKHGITIINSPGTIDSDYRGEIKIGIINLGNEPFTVKRGDRMAQLVVAPVKQCHVKLAETLDSTERGDGGFGHTGV